MEKIEFGNREQFIWKKHWHVWAVKVPMPRTEPSVFQANTPWKATAFGFRLSWKKEACNWRETCVWISSQFNFLNNFFSVPNFRALLEIKFFDYQMKHISTKFHFSIEKVMKEIKPVDTEKCEIEKRGKSFSKAFSLGSFELTRLRWTGKYKSFPRR